MNLSKEDYKTLYKLQDEVLNMLQDQFDGFYLTGGTALGRFYLNHRYSDDPDFFINNDKGFTDKINHIYRIISRSFAPDETTFIWMDIYSKAFEKQIMNETDIFMRLSTFPVELISLQRWHINPVDLDQFAKKLRTVSDDFLLGRENSLGAGKIPITDAQLRKIM